MRPNSGDPRCGLPSAVRSPPAYFTSLEACIERDVVGPANGCAPIGSGSGTGNAVYSGTLTGAGDDLQPSCANDSSADVQVKWTAPTTGRYGFSTDGSSAELNLAIYTACGFEQLDRTAAPTENGDAFRAFIGRTQSASRRSRSHGPL